MIRRAFRQLVVMLLVTTSCFIALTAWLGVPVGNEPPSIHAGFWRLLGLALSIVVIARLAGRFTAKAIVITSSTIALAAGYLHLSSRVDPTGLSLVGLPFFVLMPPAVLAIGLIGVRRTGSTETGTAESRRPSHT